MVKKVTVPLDQVREIQFNINAIAELEERFSVPATQLFDEKRVGIGLMRALVYIGLKHGGMQFKGKSVQADEEANGAPIQEHWINEGRSLDELMEEVLKAFESAGIFATKEQREAEVANPDVGTDN